MNKLVTATAIGSMAAFMALTTTQGLAETAGDGMPPAPRVERAGSIAYLNGGAGEEARIAIERMQGGFALRNVFSGQGGQYVVAERVTVRDARGQATEIRNAGPILVMDLPPGRYTIEAEVDGRLQRKEVTLTQQPLKLNWNWRGA